MARTRKVARRVAKIIFGPFPPKNYVALDNFWTVDRKRKSLD